MSAEDVALAFAAARAGHAAAIDPQLLGELHAAAARTGRRVVELPGRRVVVGWADGYGPNLDGDTLAVARLTGTRLVALGICLGLCWDPDGPRWPGREATEQDFDDQLAALGGAPIHVKGALPVLHETGLIRFADGRIRLGPALGAWSEASWNELRVLRGRLPGSPA